MIMPGKLNALALLSVVMFVAPQAYAQSFPVCASANSDSDGDGYGWENNASCLVVTDTTTTEDNADCVDSDGDGYGWDGVATCLVNATPVNTIPVNTDSATCVDSDGDGYGWDGTSTCLIEETSVTTDPVDTDSTTCIDSDGDGYGWDGTSTCLVGDTEIIDTTQELYIPPYRNRYLSSTAVEWLASGSDGITTNGWVFGPPANYPNINPTRPSMYVSAVVRCGDPDITLEDPSNPGMFFDAAKGETCAKSSTLAIPAPELVEFTDIGIEVLYEDGNEWSCAEESRSSMDAEFEANGSIDSLIFHKDRPSQATISIADRTYTGTWDLSGSIFRLNFDFGTGLPDFQTNLSYVDGKLTLYRSGLTRLSCDRIREENYPYNLYGNDKAEMYRDMWNALIGDSNPPSQLSSRNTPDNNLDQLQTSQLAGRTMQCSLLYRELDKNRSNLTSSLTALQTEVTITDEGVLQNDLLSRGGSIMNFYRYTDDLFLLHDNRGSGGSETSSVYACETII